MSLDSGQVQSLMIMSEGIINSLKFSTIFMLFWKEGQWKAIRDRIENKPWHHNIQYRTLFVSLCSNVMLSWEKNCDIVYSWRKKGVWKILTILNQIFCDDIDFGNGGENPMTWVESSHTGQRAHQGVHHQQCHPTPHENSFPGILFLVTPFWLSAKNTPSESIFGNNFSELCLKSKLGARFFGLKLRSNIIILY